MSSLAFLFQFSDQRNIFKNEACALFYTGMWEIVFNVCPFFVFYPLWLAGVCELKIWIKPEQVYSADTKKAQFWVAVDQLCAYHMEFLYSLFE